MYTKKLLSAAAAMAVLSSGAMAFDAWHFDMNGTDPDVNTVGMTGVIVAERDNDTVLYSSYQDANMSDTVINRGNSRDALIYPAFNQKDGWGTEIVVRNTSKVAVIAKAVIYDGKDSHEVKDFNIYLSPYDVCRFTIKNGRITSNDGSIRTYGIYPHQATTLTLQDVQTAEQDLTDYAAIKFANEKPFDEELKTETGYVIIYGMEQVDTCQKTIGRGTTTQSATTTITNVNNETASKGCFHNDHAGLYAAYAASLDSARPGWRALTDPNGNMYKGMFYQKPGQNSVVTVAPDVNATDTVTSYKWNENDAKIVEQVTTFGDVTVNLTGTVRVFNPAGRDMLLRAAGIYGFTNNRRMLWTEGEYASLADRCIQSNGTVSGNLHASYNWQCVKQDAATFSQSNTVYTFANAQGDIKENKLIVTQPYKRILAQLDANGTVTASGKHKATSTGLMRYFSYTGKGNFVDTAENGLEKVETGTSYKFVVNQTIYDEDEMKNAQAIGGTIITSPRTSDGNVVAFNNEVQEVNSDQLEKASDLKGAYDKTNGFIRFSLGSASATQNYLPAVTTQMVGSVVGSSAETNWVYTGTMRSN